MRRLHHDEAESMLVYDALPTDMGESGAGLCTMAWVCVILLGVNGALAALSGHGRYLWSNYESSIKAWLLYCLQSIRVVGRRSWWRTYHLLSGCWGMRWCAAILGSLRTFLRVFRDEGDTGAVNWARGDT